jgi:mannose-6-phosphate isomerase-like protein (cupin superfamily)
MTPRSETINGRPDQEKIMKKRIGALLLLMIFAGLLAWSRPRASPQQIPGKTDQSKYGKYIISKDIYRVIPEEYAGTSLVSHKGELKADVSIGYHCVVKPILFSETHTHANEEILCFIGGNPRDITDFGAEIEMTMGAEREKHLITHTACVTIPANVPHCPLNIRKVDKPIVFLEISLARSYKAPGSSYQ